MLTPEQRQRVGEYSAWVEGYRTTISSTVDSLEPLESGEDRCVFKYVLVARDRMSDNRVKVQTFDGEVTLIKVGGDWCIYSAKSSKSGERIE